MYSSSTYSIAQETEDGILNIGRVVCGQRGSDRSKELIVRVLLRHFTGLDSPSIAERTGRCQAQESQGGEDFGLHRDRRRYRDMG